MLELNVLMQLSVWAKATPTLSLPRYEWAYDAHGNLIRFQDYGNRDSKHGWEIDHYPTPKALGGSDHLDNLRPLHCKANASHGGLLGNALSTLGRREAPLSGLFGYPGNMLANALRNDRS